MKRALGRSRAIVNIDMARASTMLLVGLFVSAGCASATGQGTRTSTAARAASTGLARLQPAGSRSIRSGDSGIAGQTVAIVCGGPASEQGCPRRPVVATIDILRMPSQQRIATVRTDTRGNFRRNLLPGDYKLQAHSSSQMIWARPVTVQILRHQFERTTITFAPRHPLPVAPGSASG
jgi:hypothetical protein